jgi:putative sporulation protein YyaC
MISQNEQYNTFVNEFSTILYNLKMDKPFSNYIFLCIGSDKIIGDSYGPLVGQKLKENLKNMYNNIEVYGTLDKTISAINIEKNIEKIYYTYKSPCIIAIDSALGTQEKIGKIYVSNQKLECGKGLGKRSVLVGDISIKGVVGKDYKIQRYNMSSLQNASLGEVIKLADVTAMGIYNTIKFR